jgi:hypothetical protein
VNNNGVSLVKWVEEGKIRRMKASPKLAAGDEEADFNEQRNQPSYLSVKLVG